MLFRQLVHRESSTYTYLIGSRFGGKGLLIDPVADELALYLRLLDAFELKLELAIDTHFHTDHISALGLLRDRTQCVTARGGSPGAARELRDGELIDFDGIDLQVLHTPGHTPDSYSFVMDDRVFTGDTLLIGSTGRTDQGGDPRLQYESLGRLLALPGRTLVYPAHDYHGRHVSTIAEERRNNPRLQLQTADEYVALMNSSRPVHVDHMDVVESSSLRRSGVLLRELVDLRAALERDGTWTEALADGPAHDSGAPTSRPQPASGLAAARSDRQTPDPALGDQRSFSGRWAQRR
ncbi:MAG TPA: MBL fold metallo-hydrolase [Polyangiaceae bacterium]|jgi:glyoxylase-like metal-dependent hydrolase (beta-lactamase superfamily II)|nr:MBL fold metallo-hydrolase [Polyangiaceae bacterium]